MSLWAVFSEWILSRGGNDSTGTFLKMTVSWVVVPWHLVEVYQHSQCVCCLHIRCLLLPSPGILMMEAVKPSEMSVDTCHTTWQNIPDDITVRTLYLNCEKSQLYFKCYYRNHCKILLATELTYIIRKYIYTVQDTSFKSSCETITKTGLFLTNFETWKNPHSVHVP
jgi:hypothetical protein